MHQSLVICISSCPMRSAWSLVRIMQYKFLFTALLSLLPVAIAADPRYCQGKANLDPKDFTLKESADNAHLPVLSKHFKSKGKIASVTAVLQSANRALKKDSPPVGKGSPAESWAWNSGDDKTKEWVPQGITSSADALGKGTWNEHEAWIVSWYRDGDRVRLSFVDRKTHKYRHVMLVYPTADDDFKSITIHAGGIMWYGNVLYVVDTKNGIRAFDLDNIWEVEIADGVGKSKDGKSYSADGYRYVLPQIRWYKWTPGNDSPFRFSWISLDRSDSPDTLMVGEFVRDGEKFKNTDTPVPIRYVKYNLDASTRRLHTNNGIATASWAHCVNIPNVQGAVSYEEKFYISRSTGRAPKQGDLFVWEEGKTAVKHQGWFMAGNEDMSFNPVRKEYYTVTEYDGAIGRQFCDIALQEGHRLTLFVRNAGKVPEHIRLNAATKILEGTLELDSDLNEVAECGADIFVSLAGPSYGTSGTPLTNGYQLLIPKLASHKMSRVLILCTPSYRDQLDVETWKWRAGEWFMKIFSSGQYQEMVGVGKAVSSAEGIQWGLYRVGGLTNGPEAPVETTYLGSGADQTWISRASVARWVLNEATEGKWIGKTPYICNK
ncbi:unnamed protein product [Penicillium salamii]|nr:unnamed protein product [Penicillium salamii]